MILLASLLIQLTAPSAIDLGDPSPPQFVDGHVQVTTTGGVELTWPTVTDFFEGHEPKRDFLRICHPDGTPLDDDNGEDIWDPTLENNTLIGSVMATQNAKWPDDAASRRTFAFHFKNGCWTRDRNPLWKSPKGWLGHTYGHGELEGYLFYERVTSTKDGQPWTTDLFVRKGNREIPILKAHGWLKAKRESGAELVEGPRPFKIGSTYFISFSAGDYSSDDYGIHLATAATIEGPYTPITEDGDLKDFGREIEQTVPMTWGAGRAAYFEYGGQWWMIFHGIPKPFDGPDGHRQLFLSPAALPWAASITARATSLPERATSLTARATSAAHSFADRSCRSK